MNKLWHVANDCWYQKDITSTNKKLKNGIYNLEFDMKTGELYLKEFGTKFTFNYKIYDLQDAFIKRVLKSFKGTQGNFGVLFNGIKGTSKTVTAKMIANELDLPVILISQNYPRIVDFLSSIDQDVIILIDEFEKVFSRMSSDYDTDDDGGKKGTHLLSIMDGIYNNEYRKVFLLTTNASYINENMLNRTGRIRFFKNFGDLTIEQVNLIMDDLLIHTEFRNEILDFIRPLKIITVDIIKCIISEVNIQEESPFVCCEDFNIEFKDTKYDIFKILEDGKLELLHEEVTESRFSNFITGGSMYGWEENAFRIGNTVYKNISKPDYFNLVFNVTTGGNSDFKIKLVKVKKEHKIFESLVM